MIYSYYFSKILAHAALRAKISEQQQERIKSSGLGMLTAWSPQQFILNHPVLDPYLSFSWLNTQNKILPQATGWFVTHGGFNSVIESLGSGIPL
jgi:hypothetical protein